jgi:hypothetical protein
LYFEVDEHLRAADQAEYIHQNLEGAYKNIIAPSADRYLTDKERDAIKDGTFYMPDLKKPRSQWTDQDYLNYYSIVIFYVTSQSDDEEGLRTGTDTFTSIQEWANDYPDVGLISLYRAVDTPLSGRELKPTSVNNVVIDELGGRFVGHESLVDGRVDYSLFANRSDEENNIIPINERTFDTINDPLVQDLIKNNLS